jgi:hypothetical protein
VAEHEPSSVEADRDVFRCSESADADMLFARRRKHCCEIVSSCKVHRVIEPGIGADASLKALCGTVDFPQQLYLEPAISGLDGLGRGLRACKLSDSEQADCPDEIDKALRDAHE